MYTTYILLLVFTLAHTQTPLNFGEITTLSCVPSTNVQYTLTVPQWPATPAQAFVIELRSPSTWIFPVTASVGNTSWEVLADSQNGDVGELWVPIQSAGTVVNVVVACPGIVGYTLEPVIPSAISNSTKVPNFNFTSVNDESTPHARWWAVPKDASLAGYLWAELCQIPTAPLYRFNMRVVFPGMDVTKDACTGQGNTYQLSGSSNFRQDSKVGVAVSWGSSSTVPPVFYVSVYGSASGKLVSVNFNVYLTNMDAPIQYYGGAAGLYAGNGIQVEKDLFITGVPANTDIMKLYFIEDWGAIETPFFSSACYLRTQAQKALFPGKLKNSSDDTDISISVVKAPNFFKGRSNYGTTFALTYGDYVVLPNVRGATRFNGYTSNGAILFGATIGLAIVAAFLLGIVLWMGIKLRRAGYNGIH